MLEDGSGGIYMNVYMLGLLVMEGKYTFAQKD